MILKTVLLARAFGHFGVKVYKLYLSTYSPLLRPLFVYFFKTILTRTFLNFL